MLRNAAVLLGTYQAASAETKKQKAHLAFLNAASMHNLPPLVFHGERGWAQMRSTRCAANHPRAERLRIEKAYRRMLRWFLKTLHLLKLLLVLLRGLFRRPLHGPRASIAAAGSLGRRRVAGAEPRSSAGRLQRHCVAAGGKRPKRDFV